MRVTALVGVAAAGRGWHALVAAPPFFAAPDLMLLNGASRRAKRGLPASAVPLDTGALAPA